MHKRRILLAACAAALLLAAPASFAKPGTLQLASVGSGELQLGPGRAEPISRARVTLQGNGYASITLYGRRQHLLTGRWQGQPGGVADITIFSAFGRPGVSGGGRLVLHPNERNIQSLSLDGAAGGESFSVTFAQGAPGWGGPLPGDDGYGGPPPVGLDAGENGYGTLIVDGRAERVRHAHVSLQPDRRAVITVSTSHRVVFPGRWSARRGGQIYLDIAGGHGPGWNGTGRVILTRDARSFEEIELNGYSAGRRFSLRFTPY